MTTANTTFSHSGRAWIDHALFGFRLDTLKQIFIRFHAKLNASNGINRKKSFDSLILYFDEPNVRFGIPPVKKSNVYFRNSDVDARCIKLYKGNHLHHLGSLECCVQYFGKTRCFLTGNRRFSVVWLSFPNSALLPTLMIRPPVRDFRIPVRYFWIPVRYFRIPVQDFRIPVRYSRIPVRDFRLSCLLAYSSIPRS